MKMNANAKVKVYAAYQKICKFRKAWLVAAALLVVFDLFVTLVCNVDWDLFVTLICNTDIVVYIFLIANALFFIVSLLLFLSESIFALFDLSLFDWKIEKEKDGQDL